MRAAQKGHLEVVKYLVQAGADKERKNKVRDDILLHFKFRESYGVWPQLFSHLDPLLGLTLIG
jgi:hypothetical protein